MKQTKISKQAKKQGFSLLELLLVVGIAAILIVAGITTYNLVNKGNQINAATSLVNTIMDQTRRLYGGQNTYGAASIETALFNSGSVPARYKSATAGQIATPFADSAIAIAITGATQNFVVALAVPPAYAPELAVNFNPAQSTDIIGLNVCGTAITPANAATALNAATLSGQCGASTTIPAAANLTITAK